MACKDCGQQQQAAQQPCRTFTFPLGAGSVELTLRGEIITGDVGPLRNWLGLVLDLLTAALPSMTTEEESHG